VKVSVVVAGKSVKVKVPNTPPQPFPPLKEVIVWRVLVPSDTATDLTASSTAKLTSRVLQLRGMEKVV
jgi:hypothetical protein